MATNLYEYYKSQGKPLPSVQERRKIYGLSSNYTGTAQQNQQLLKGITSSTVTGISRVPQVTLAIAQQARPNMVKTAYTGSSRFVAETPDWLKPKIEAVSRKYNLPTSFVSAQLSKESIGFNQDVIYGKGKYTKGNVAGAAGIAQFIPSTARAYGLQVGGGVDDRLNVDRALDAYGRMMSGLIQKHGVEGALSAYNSGNPNNYKNPNIKTWYGSKGETYKYVRDIINRSSTVKETQPTAPVQDEFERIFRQQKGLGESTKQKEDAPSGQLKLMSIKDAVLNSLAQKQETEARQQKLAAFYNYAPYPYTYKPATRGPFEYYNPRYSTPSKYTESLPNGGLWEYTVQPKETEQNLEYKFGIPMPPVYENNWQEFEKSGNRLKPGMKLVLPPYVA